MFVLVPICFAGGSMVCTGCCSLGGGCAGASSVRGIAPGLISLVSTLDSRTMGAKYSAKRNKSSLAAVTSSSVDRVDTSTNNELPTAFRNPSAEEPLT